MKVMSIDGSTKSTGVAIIDNRKLVYYGCLTAISIDPLSRIDDMTAQIIEIYNKYKPDKIIMEDILPTDVGNNQKTFNALHYLQAAVVLALHRLKAPAVEFYVASHWRKLIGIKTGRGVKRETLKQQVMEYIKGEFGIVANDDICDAIGIGIAYINENDVLDWS